MVVRKMLLFFIQLLAGSLPLEGGPESRLVQEYFHRMLAFFVRLSCNTLVLLSIEFVVLLSVL